MMNGIIFLDKKQGKSTTQEESKLKKIFQTRKVGHAGTLDPFATGLVICGVNKGTKALTFLEGLDKVYQARLQLGVLTDSLDIDGNTIDRREVKKHSKEEILEVFSSFIGEIEQIPPMYSALKINGTPLYELARKNIEVERKARKVTIYDLKLLDYDESNSYIDFEAHVSKGTYIRTLGVDIASKLGELGYLSQLRRLKIGNYDVSLSKTIVEIEEGDLKPIDFVFPDIVKIEIEDETLYKRVINGNVITLNREEDKILFMKDKQCVALYEKVDNKQYKVLKEF